MRSRSRSRPERADRPDAVRKSYYLEPEKTGQAVALLRQALLDSDRTASGDGGASHAPSLAVLRVRDDVIVLQTMMWPDEIRQPDFGSVDTSDAKPAEVKMANMLVETLAGDFEPASSRTTTRDGRRGDGQGEDRGR